MCTVGNPNTFHVDSSGDVLESHGDKPKNGHLLSEIIYHNDIKKWAEIKSKPNDKDWWKTVAEGANTPGFDELVLEARKRYPVGTRYVCLHNCGEGKIETEDVLEPVVVKDVIKVGDYAIMTKAGGWGYDERNNGCLAKVTKVSTRYVDGKNRCSINGEVINPRIKQCLKFSIVPQNTDDIGEVWRKATQAEIDAVVNDVSTLKKKEEYFIGSYIVWIKKPSGNAEVGDIDKIISQEDRFLHLKKYGSCCKSRIRDKEVQWFATLEEAQLYTLRIAKDKEFVVGDWITLDGWKRAYRIKKVLVHDYVLDCEEGDDIGTYPKKNGFRYATRNEIEGKFVPRDEITSAKTNIKSTGPDFSLKEEPEITKGIDLIN